MKVEADTVWVVGANEKMTYDFIISMVGRRSTGNSLESGISGARNHRRKMHGSEISREDCLA